MKAIPKFQQGGNIDYFTEYIPAPRKTQNTQKATKNQSSSNSKEKDDKLDSFMDIFKSVDGLPNEMNALMNSFGNLLYMSKFTGQNIDETSTQYLSILSQLKIMNSNKKAFDEALKRASTNGALYEPAIGAGGSLIVQRTSDGEVTAIDPSAYDTNKYKILTISNVAYLRKNDPDFINNDSAIDIINNGMSTKVFQSLVTAAKNSLGTSNYSRTGNFSIEGKAIKGLELLQNLSKEDLVQITGSVTSDGLYEYKVIDKNQKSQIDALTTYILATLPDNAKTWAKVKLSGTGANIKDLIMQYLVGSENVEHTIDLTYKGSEDKVRGGSKGKSGSNNEEDPKKGFWAQVMSGEGGTSSSFNLLKKQGTMSVDGKFYGATPGPEQNCSLGDYIIQSGVGYLIKNPNNVTFGNIPLDKNSFNDIMVNRSSGAYVANLPTKNGKVWVEAAEVYSDFVNELKNSRLKQGSPEYQRKVKELLNNEKYALLAPLISDGRLKPSNSGKFLILEGVASSKAAGISSETRNRQSISDFNSQYIKQAGNDPNLYDTLKQGLSSKDRGEYELDYNEWYDVPSWFNRYDKLYEGNIYIPLNNNLINAMNADENDIKQSTAHKYEEAQQIWEKDDNQRPTNSEILIQ